ncbi:hypothetical protein ZWY2020_023941 [Hordeum vulgare]|nr:hypothetical protein ZWY2020_023941 [Hordeum vulgare]
MPLPPPPALASRPAAQPPLAILQRPPDVEPSHDPDLESPSRLPSRSAGSSSSSAEVHETLLVEQQVQLAHVEAEEGAPMLSEGIHGAALPVSLVHSSSRPASTQGAESEEVVTGISSGHATPRAARLWPPKHSSRHSRRTPFQAGLKINQQGGNDNLVRDLLMVLAETLINGALFADYLVQTHNPWGAEIILHLVGNCLALLIGFGHIGVITYKAHAHRVFADEEAQATAAAMDGNEIEQEMVEEEGGSKITRTVLVPATMEKEIAGRAAIEDDDGGANEGEKVLPKERFEAMGASAA